MIDTFHIIQICTILATIGLVINSIELVIARRENEKLFEWEIVKSRHYSLVRKVRLGNFADSIFRFPIHYFGLLQAMVAVLSNFFIGTKIGAFLITIVVISQLLIHYRMIWGFDGSDQMQTVVWSGLLIFSLANSDWLKELAVGFIAFQSILSYFTAGWAKAISPTWRNGSAVGLILASEGYSTGFGRKLSKSKTISCVFSWGTILFEVLGPFLILFGNEATIIFLVIGGMFHIGVALTMGLNNFVWAFLSTYAPIFWLSGFIKTSLF